MISELAGRLSHLQDVPGIAQTIVAETRQLIDYDTIRVYRVDRDTGWCEPIAFQGSLPRELELRRRLACASRIGEGLDRLGRRARPDDPPGRRPRRPAVHHPRVVG